LRKVVGKILHMHSSNTHTYGSIPFDSRHAAWAEEGLKSVFNVTYPGIPNPQPRPLRYLTERTIFSTCNEAVDGHNHSIHAKFSGVPTPLQGMTRLSMKLRKGKGTMLRMWMQAILLNTHRLTPNGFQRQNWHSKWDAL